MTELKTHSGELLSDSKDIRKEMNDFYQDLFSEEEVDLEAQDWLLDQLSMSLDEQEQVSCEGFLTVEECREALNGMNTGNLLVLTASRLNSIKRFGLSWEMAWLKFSTTVFSMVSFLSLSVEACCLWFSKRAKRDLRNWRPISLLCVDYKIGTKALVARLQKVLSSVLHEDQTCGVPGRSILSNLNLVRDLIEYCNSKNLPLAIINPDQEKAFDRVNWNFLDRVLQRMNLGPEFRQWIRVIYTNISSACLHSGFVTSFFEISRGGPPR